MEQATQPATPTAPSEARTPDHAHGTAFQRAAAVAADIVGPLHPEPFSVRIDEDWPAGWRVCLIFRDDTAQGMYALGALLRVPVTEATVTDGVHLDICTRVKGIEVCGTALVSPAQAAVLRGEPTPVAPSPAASTTPAAEDQSADDTVTEMPVPEVLPLGASVIASVAAVSPQAAPGADAL